MRNVLLLIFILCGIANAQELYIESIIELGRDSSIRGDASIEQIAPNEIAFINLRDYHVIDTLGRVLIERIIPGCDTTFSLESRRRYFRLDDDQMPGWLSQKALRIFDDEGYPIGSDLYITRVNDDGDSLWSFIHNIEDYYGCSGICEAGENIYWAGGVVGLPENGPVVMHFLKFNTEGEILVEHFHDFQPGDSAPERVFNIAASGNGGLIATGMKSNHRTDKEFGWMLRLDSVGDTVWTRMVEAASETLIIRNTEFVYERNGEFSQILELDDGNYLVGGVVKGQKQDPAWMLKISPDGEILWEKEIGFIGEDIESADFDISGFLILNDGNILFWGKEDKHIVNWLEDKTVKDLVFYVYDLEGNLVHLYMPEFENLRPSLTIGYSMGSGFFAFTGSISFQSEHYANPLIRFSWVPNEVREQPDETIRSFTLFTAFPNPFNSSARVNFTMPVNGAVSLSLYNLNGRMVDEIFNGVKPAGVHSSTVNANNLPAGVYFLKLDHTTGTTTQKIMLRR